MLRRLRLNGGPALAEWFLAVTCLASWPVAAGAVDLIGYVPYYRMSGTYLTSYLPHQLPMLDEIRYFGLTVNSSGVITPLPGSDSLATQKSKISAIADDIAGLPADRRPRLDITLGGDGQAMSFSTIAASPTLRATFAANISTFLNQTKTSLNPIGATSVDIDWEHPAATGPDLNNYAQMVQQIKHDINVGVDSPRRVYATMTPERFMPASAFQEPEGSEGVHAIDGVSLMTYDLSWWSNGGDGHIGEHSLPDYVTDSLNAWTDPPGSTNKRTYVFPKWGNGISASVLGIGMPLYGRGLKDADDDHSGDAFTYAQLVASGTTADGNYYTYNNAPVDAHEPVWTLDPDLVKQRVQFAHDRGLKNIIMWELGQDLDPTNAGSLLKTAYLKNETLGGDFDGNGIVDANDYAVWQSTFGNTTGDMRADGNGDGAVNAADFTVWRDHMTNLGTGASSSFTVPEPATIRLLVIASSLIMGRILLRRSSV
jgi:GH18 family chitinase